MNNKELFENFIPYEIVFDTIPVSIKWIENANLDLNFPFFEESIADLKKNKAPNSILSSLEQLIEFAGDQWTSNAFDGYIFHTSRCGSTLISNTLKAHENCVVFSEPQPFSVLMLPFQSGIWNSTEENFMKMREQLFRALENIYLNFINKRFNTSKAFIKFCSWNIMSIEWLAEYRDKTPILINYRDPIEILVSLQKKGNVGIAGAKNIPKVASAMTGIPENQIAELKLTEYFSMALNSYYRAGNKISNRLATMFVDYKELNFETMISISSFFQIPFDKNGIRDRIMNQLATYSKDISKKKLYVDDSSEKQNTADRQILEESEKHCRKSYTRLLTRTSILS